MKKLLQFAGFSLVEMAIVLVIVALLLAGLLPMISGQMEQQQRTETRKQMEEIRSSLLGFAVSMGRLPCPDNTGDGNEDIAAPTTPTNNIPLLGQSTRITPCSADSGYLPSNTLGTPTKDAFGSAYLYAVTPAFGGKNEIFSATNAGGTLLNTLYFSLASTGTIKICNATTNADTTPCPTPRLIDNAAAVVISKGPNWASTASTEESENIDGDSDFISHDNSANFDDLLVWLSPNTIFNRMVTAGKLP